jgi:branched-chain amino acid transport system substrate-binding protein
MTRKRVALAASALLGCADPSPLRIAVVEGSGSHFAAELAAEDINAAGGINGRLLELVVVTEPPDVTPQDAIAVADSLAGDPSILAVVGHGGSATSLAASQVYNARGLPQLAPTTTSPLYTAAGPYSFRMVASDEHQVEFIATQIEADPARPTVSVMYVNDDYGLALRGLLVQSLRRRGVTVVHEAPFIRGPEFEGGVDDLVGSVRAAQPGLVVWIGLAPELRILRPRLRAALPDTRVLGSDGVSFIVASGDLAPFESDRVVALVDVTANRPDLRSLAGRYRPLAGGTLTDAAALTYDAVAILAAAMRSGAHSRDAIRSFLEDGAVEGRAYEGIAGTTVLDENGDARPAYVLLEIRAGTTSVVAR